MGKTTHYKARDGGVEYTKEPWSACWKSRENGVHPGSVRMIDGTLHHAMAVYGGRFWRTDTVLWIPVRLPDAAWEIPAAAPGED